MTRPTISRLQAALATSALLLALAPSLGQAQGPAGASLAIGPDDIFLATEDLDLDAREIQGTIQAAGGRDLVLRANRILIGPDARVLGADGEDGLAGNGPDARGGDGTAGRSLTLIAGEVRAMPGAVLRAGDGGDGGDAVGATAAEGGHGADGGLLLIEAPAIALEGAFLLPGRGGDGGDAKVVTDAMDPAPTRVRGGDGGDQGLLLVNGAAVEPSPVAAGGRVEDACDVLLECPPMPTPDDGVRLVSTTATALMEGIVRIANDPPGVQTGCPTTPRGADGQSHTLQGEAGGDGGDGCIELTGSDGAAGIDGSSGWTCSDGTPGSPGTSVSVGGVVGGHGGTGYIRGGDGGDAIGHAWAGNGGKGGNGGETYWYSPYPDCEGGNGGAGGSANGGTLMPGNGGNAICGEGGSAGDADSIVDPGSGGAGGSSDNGGSDDGSPGPNGAATPAHVVAGTDGASSKAGCLTSSCIINVDNGNGGTVPSGWTKSCTGECPGDGVMVAVAIQVEGSGTVTTVATGCDMPYVAASATSTTHADTNDASKRHGTFVCTVTVSGGSARGSGHCIDP